MIRDGKRHDDDRDHRSAPIAQENEYNERREHEADRDRLAERADRRTDELGLVVPFDEVNRRLLAFHERVQLLFHVRGERQ